MSLLGLLQLLGIGLLLALALAVWAMVYRLRHPPRRSYSWAVAKGVAGDPAELDQPLPFAEIELTTGRRGVLAVPAWRIDGGAAAGPTVLFTPGWGDSRIGGLVRLPGLLPAAREVILWDPPGAGQTPGRGGLGATESALLVHISRRLLEDDPERLLVLAGASLGAGASIVAGARLAEEPRLVGVVAEGPYRQPWTPAYEVMRQARLPWRINGPIAFAVLGVRLGQGPRWRGFDRAQWAARLRCPLLVLHGEFDEMCPLTDGQAIAEAAPQGQLAVLEGGRHNDLWTDPELAGQAAAAVNAFLQLIPGPASGPAPLAGPSPSWGRGQVRG